MLFSYRIHAIMLVVIVADARNVHRQCKGKFG